MAATPVSESESRTVAAYEFPSSVLSSFSYWAKSFAWSAGSKAEESLVRRGLGGDIPLVSPDEASNVSGKRAVLHKVLLDGSEKDKKRWMRVLEIGNPQRAPDEHVVFFTHGYGNGLGFYFQQYQALASVNNVRLFFVDWLGMGCSGRPTFPNIKHGEKNEAAVKRRVTEAEEWFTTSLKDCAAKLGIDKIHTLCGHSIGAYLSSSYALRFPTAVGKLILISPVGIPEAPWNDYAFEDDDVEARAQEQFELNQQAANALEEQMIPAADVQAGTLASMVASSGRSGPGDSSGPGARKEPPTGWWVKLWERNVSPFSILRGATFMGPSLISRYANRRFSAFTDDVKQELFAYLYQISTDRGSGEYVLAHVLAPGVFARWPLKKRLGRCDLPITLIYGDNDWMDESAGRDALEIIMSKPESPATARQKERSKVLINQHSGHWTHLENPAGFNAQILKEIKDSIQDQA